MSDPSSSDDELIGSITPDVMKFLAVRGFFEKLDDLFCPLESSHERQRCAGNYEASKSILRSLGFSDVDIEDICAVLAAQGGCCDCEILYNIVETSRLKAEYCRAQLEHTHHLDPHGFPK
jgi:hypothetical protein